MESAHAVRPELESLSNDALDDELCQLCSHIYAAEYRLALAIREWEARDLCAAYGVKSTAHWLNYKCGIALGAAREKVRVARALADLPRVSALFARGRISYSKVRALTRVATPDNEPCLINLAQHGTASHLERTVSAYRRVERLNDPERILRQRRERGIRWHWDDEGMLVIHGRLAPEDGALLIRAIESARDRIWREERAEESDDVHERCHGRVERDVASPTAARRSDALMQLLQTAAKAEPRALGGPERLQVLLHVPVAATHLSIPAPANRASPAGVPTDRTHCSQAPRTGPPATSADTALPPQPLLDSIAPVAWSTVRRLTCDAARAVVLETQDGRPLSIGRRSRSVPWPLRRALERRDGGCRFPGCTEHRYVDAHHIHHWADGGGTSLDNLVLLCRHHHRLVHEEGFSCRRAADGKIVFNLPDGQPMPDAAPPKEGSCTDLVTQHRRAGLGISAETCNGGWDGSPFHLSEAVAALFDATYGAGWSPPPRPERRQQQRDLSLTSFADVT